MEHDGEARLPERIHGAQAPEDAGARRDHDVIGGVHRRAHQRVDRAGKGPIEAVVSTASMTVPSDRR